jgi:hypothetical protein
MAVNTPAFRVAKGAQQLHKLICVPWMSPIRRYINLSPLVRLCRLSVRIDYSFQIG